MLEITTIPLIGVGTLKENSIKKLVHFKQSKGT